MQVIQELPEVFEAFAEQRQKSFLTVKEYKDKGIPVIGSYCTYFPQEIAMAMGAASVSLCSTSDETLQEAEKDLPKNLCPLIKSSYGFAKTEKCPYFYFSDVVVGETTCDGKKKMYELMSEFKDVFLLQLPQTQTEEAALSYRKEIIRFKEYLEKKFSVKITDAQVREAVHRNNEIRLAIRNLYEVMKNDPLWKHLPAGSQRHRCRDGCIKKEGGGGIQKGSASGKKASHRDHRLSHGGRHREGDSSH